MQALFVSSRLSTLIGWLALCALPGAGCRTVEKSISPSHFRDWTPEQALLPHAEFQGEQVTIRNVRNCQYFANDVYLVDFYDKTIDLNAVRGVDFIIAPFAAMPTSWPSVSKRVRRSTNSTIR
jgi:hypothetical protein